MEEEWRFLAIDARNACMRSIGHGDVVGRSALLLQLLPTLCTLGQSWSNRTVSHNFKPKRSNSRRPFSTYGYGVGTLPLVCELKSEFPNANSNGMQMMDIRRKICRHPCAV